MAAIEFDSLDIEQGFNFKQDIQKTIGHIVAWTVSKQEIKADMKLKNPMDAIKTGNHVVGVLSSVTWGGGAGEPFAFKFNISTKNKQVIAKILHEQLTSTEVLLQFKVWDYDPVLKEWFVALNNQDANLKCLIKKEDKDLKLALSKEPGAIKSPENWGVELEVVAQPYEQGIGFCVSKGVNVAKIWGVEALTGP